MPIAKTTAIASIDPYKLNTYEKTYEVLVDNISTYSDASGNSAPVGGLKKGCIFNGILKGQWVQVNRISKGSYYGPGSGYIRSTTSDHQDTVKERSDLNDSSSTAEDATGSEGSAEDVWADDEFTKSYSSAISDEQYLDNLKSGLKISNLRGIMGLPHQFLPNTDIKILDSDNTEYNDLDLFGRVYAEKIISPMPLLFMTPGTPSFMAKFKDSQKKTLLENIFNNTKKIGNFDDLVGNDGGKYYSLKYAYVDYFAYVNAMLRSAAFFLGIEDEKLDENGKTLGEFNWFFDNGGDASDIFDNNGLSKFLGTYAGAIPFYVEAETRISDDFSNSTSQSSLASSIDGVSDTARELNYLIGNVSSNLGAGGLYEEVMGIGGSAINDGITQLTSSLGSGNILSNIMSKLQTILSGGRMIFPEIWSESSFSRSYNVSIKLVSPSGDKLSIFYNILVPIYHLIGFVLPRNSYGQGYMSPFLVRAYYKGIFNIDMGIITDMSVSKGSDGEWTPDGLPTVAEVSFTIKDLYNVLSMSRQDVKDDKGILSNIAELDYIANTCGININEPEIGRTIKMAVTLGFTTKIQDKFTMGIFGNITQYFNNKIQSIFGKFDKY